MPHVINAVPVKHYGRWASAVLVAIVALMIIDTLITNPNYQWDTVASVLFQQVVLEAVGWTLLLTVGAMALGIVLALLLAIMRRSENPVLRGVSTAYIWFFRGTPVYTQLIFWGLLTVLYPRFGMGIPFTDITLFSFDPTTLTDVQTRMFIFAVLGLGFNEGAYLAEIVRGGLASVDIGQEEAAKALGMGNGMIFRRIIIPQAMRVIIPPTGNETISMLKTTSLVTAVPFSLDLNAITSNIGFSKGTPIPYLLVAAIWYLAITSILMVGQYFLERHYGRGHQGATPTFTSRYRRHKLHVSRQEAINASGTTHSDPFLEYTP
ncbi:MAG: amino acid ABC transporter permease [Actinomycetaceae bacterium]|nr:amino acid ABC transporter permease [Arcanobacterium sp.]MDD7686327.1 amino acid ABC transporter permease [Actinomycetaceae bacterium]